MPHSAILGYSHLTNCGVDLRAIQGQPGGVFIMHLGNGAITPECVVLTYGAAAVGLATGAAAARRAGLPAEKLKLAGGLGCLVFAAQAVNVPILPGASAHL